LHFFWRARKGHIRSIIVFVACSLLAACRSSMSYPEDRVKTPIRFLLTFDDGPSAVEENNPTQSILNQLKDNPVQRGIHAVFFVQTRAWNGGGTPLGQQIMQEEHSAGHVLGFHTASPEGHVGHVRMSLFELRESLVNGVDDIRRVTGQRPVWLRPPYFAYSDSTAQAYRDAGFRLILSDLSANDGFIHATSFRRRSHFFNRLLDLHRRLSSIRDLPDPVPVVVTFHDVNRFTAENMVEYLQILVEESREAGLVMTEKPFYDSRQGVQDALNVWWEFNEALRLVCDKHTCPPIGTYLQNGRPGDLTKADMATTLQ
jgi:peptidoglycan/xylan/chitin deacetylase (PgdA/CDA1 family)